MSISVKTTLRLNHASIKKKIDQALESSESVKRLAYNKAYGIFYYAKRMMLKEFDRHPVTQEILWGPKALNISETLDGYGNLFSFIGFEEGDEPIVRLRNLLELGTEFRQTVYRNRMWHFRITTPSKDAITAVTQMPWERGNSWAFGVETFISGLSHYMYKKWVGSNSRSGMGLQLPYENLEDAAFSGRPYLKEIFQSFRERINKDR